MRAAIYARVSTSDKDQDPANQIYALMEYCEKNGHSVEQEHIYVDRASAMDTRRRHELYRLEKDLYQNKFDMVLIWKLDRMFRDMKMIYDWLEVMQQAGKIFVSATEDWNTSTPVGKLLLNMSATFAQFERDVISERVNARNQRAIAEGLPIGPETIEERNPKLKTELPLMIQRVERGEINKTQAARELGVTRPTFHRRYKAYITDKEEQDGTSWKDRIDPHAFAKSN